MKKYIHHNIVAIIMLTVIFVRTSFAQENLQLNIGGGISASLPELVDIKSVNTSLKLDSIYEDLNIGYKTIKRKWLFNYDNNNLTTKEHLYYSDDYSKPLNLREEWFYNERGQVVKYQERDVLTTLSDSLFVKVLQENTYAGDNIILIKSKTVSRASAGGNYVNGELVLHYSIEYHETFIRNLYNTEGNLYLAYKEPTKDSIFYYYYDADHLRLRIEKINSNNQLYVEQFEYTESNTMKHISKKYDRFYNTTDVSDIEKKVLSSEYVYDYELNDYGKPNKITVTANNYGFSNYDSQTFFEYNENGQPVLISIYFWGTQNSSKSEWYEQARLVYKYNDDGNISSYQMSIYDARLHGWVIGEQKTYFYSSLKSKTSKIETSNVDVCIYPNPVNETIYLSGTICNDSKFIIHDYSGKSVSEGEMTGNSINVSNLRKGLYLINIYNDKARTVKRFIKE